MIDMKNTIKSLLVVLFTFGMVACSTEEAVETTPVVEETEATTETPDVSVEEVVGDTEVSVED